MAFPDTPVNIVAQQPLGPYLALQPTALQLALAWTAADPVQGNQFTGTGHELLLIHNADAAPQTVTIKSVALPGNLRTGDITTYSIPIGGYAMFNFAKAASIPGWSTGGLANGKVKFLASDADIMYAVLTVGATT